MPRPPKSREVRQLPLATYFKPAGVPARNLEEVALTVGEVEALRLSHLENLDQHSCAERLNVSRSTVQRMLERVHRKLADAVMNGKAIRIEGGPFQLSLRLTCEDCGSSWSARVESESESRLICPSCRAEAPVPRGGRRGRRGRGSRGRGGMGRLD